MREIEFRGKSKQNGEWVYGGIWTAVYHNDNDREVAIVLDGLSRTIIDIETLGQYTGLKDIKGKKIFEGDIVKLTEINYNYEWTAVVEFGNPNSEYVWGWNLKPITKDVECNLDILCWVEMPIGATCEIIGNIYDNPELLGE